MLLHMNGKFTMEINSFRIPIKYSERVSNSCYISGTFRVTLGKHLIVNHQ